MRGQIQVEQFSKIMLQKLKENAHKGWPETHEIDCLFNRICEEVLEMHEAWVKYKGTDIDPANQDACIDKLEERRIELAREAADVACFAMFIADLTGGLKNKETDDVRENTLFDRPNC